MPLFRLDKSQKAVQIRKTTFSKERDIQTLCEKNLEPFFNIRFIASEYSTGQKHGGRIDTLGLDENNCPVIIEYKKKESQNIVTQGLFYLDWLSDHKGDFLVATQDVLGKEIEINWSSLRLVLIAESFSKYDTHAVTKIAQNVELKAYRFYENGLLYIEDLYTPSTATILEEPKKARKASRQKHYELLHHLDGRPDEVRGLFDMVQESIMALSQEGNVHESITKQYIAYKNNKNFCEIVVQAKGLKVYIDINTEEVNDPKGVVEDCSTVGHWATGNSRFRLAPGIGPEDYEYAMSLISQAYNLTL